MPIVLDYFPSRGTAMDKKKTRYHCMISSVAVGNYYSPPHYPPIGAN